MASTVKYAPLRSSSEVEVDQCSLKVKGPSSYHTQLKPRSSSSWSLFRVLALLLTITGVVVLCVQFNLLWYMTNFLRGTTTGNDPDNLHAGKIDFFSWMTSDAEEGEERTPPVCPWVPATLKFDCYPEGGVTQEKCEARGCCWVIPDGAAGDGKPAENGSHWKVPLAEPYCYYPEDYPSYSMSDVRETATGYEAKLVRGVPSYYPDDILSLKLQVKLESRTRLHFKIFDPKQKRYEVPIETPDVSSKAAVTDYAVNFTANPFSIMVTRKTTGATLFDTSVPTLIFADQFLQLSSMLPSHHVYGLGERTGSLRISTHYTRVAMWSRDQFPQENSNLYGVHPFYMVMEEDGNSFGVFLLNSNAQEAILQPTPAITFRSLGGVLDVYVFAGPQPDDVVRQYLDVIGRPAMPPYWSLGFHLCRWGYDNSSALTDVITRMRESRIPYDTQWNDIDYMTRYLDFTLNTANYSELPKIIDDLHANNQHYVMIVDPGISSKQGAGNYPPFDEGMEMDIFIKVANGSAPILGQVWPGITAFPDWTHPAADEYWSKQVSRFHKTINFDGMWIDMNEPSSSVTGSVTGCHSSDPYDFPVYTPGVTDDSLQARTLCPSAKQYGGRHYDLHSLYGLMEMKATYKALVSVRGKRPLIISRSTFPSAGKYGGHWLGDNASVWKHMYYSITGILSFSMFGVPLIGADICGFNGNTTEQLCQRWMQLGAFYPFSRNHNSLHMSPQDPAVFGAAMQSSSRAAMTTRYLLLPYLYTQFHHAHSTGRTVATPLFFAFPKDKQTYDIDRQLLWGDALLISPVLTENTTSVLAYLPRATWYDFYTGRVLPSSGRYVTLDAPMDTINLHVREGRILPTQEPALTTVDSRKNKFGLLVALASNGVASGDLYWDDGESISAFETGAYNYLLFNATHTSLTCKPTIVGYKSSWMTLGGVTVYGMRAAPSNVTVNGKSATFTYDDKHQVLYVKDMAENMLAPIVVHWKLP